ncbi:DNA polymerase II large subunit [Candidatus Micrarchaeota archaeon]|nr:DNA polymerase II large subunit [Candidatus Micrarchaeota archaeon]
MIENYNETLKDGLQKAYAVATEARKREYDPADYVEVMVARDVAARVESIVGPPNIANEIRGMEAEGIARTDIAFAIARKIAAGEVIKANREFLIEQAVRTGVGILTEGVLVAPTEGMSKIRIKKNPDGSDYVAVYYAGPIRSAGGTAAALSVVLADIARRVAGVGDYRATDSQIERYVEEIGVYEARVAHLQYYPPEDDIRAIVKNCPICVDGDPTEDMEVSAYKGIPGVETDRIRGGMPLVICEGIALKATKVLKYTKRLNLGWDWLEGIIKIKSAADKIEIKPDWTYLDGVVAGRPVFSHPSAKGGFRLRYGRSETNGLMAKNVHPAAMTLLGNFLAYGTHMKIERPGKGCVIVPHAGIEPPVVRLADGRVMKVRSIAEAKNIAKDVVEILFLGDMLSNYGDFLKSNHPLIPSGYCAEIWEKEIEAMGLAAPENLDAAGAFAFSKEHGAPLHPAYVYPWHDITPGELKKLADWLKKATLSFEGGKLKSLVLQNDDAKRALELLFVEHGVYDGRVVLDGENGYAVLASLGMLDGDKIDSARFDALWNENRDALGLVNEISGVKIKAWAPTYIGARMGRPEKAKERMMAGKPHVLFPTSSFKNRSISKQYRMLKDREAGRTINTDLARLRCGQCGALTFYRRCHACGGKASVETVCQKCGKAVNTEMHCDMKTVGFDKRPVDFVALFEKVKNDLSASPDDVRGVKGLSNASRIPERLEKGFIRSKHEVYVFRDGTARFDATDVPLTHFKPGEIEIDAGKARELGYEKDYLGNPLENDGQIVPIFPQDIVLSENGAVYLKRVAAFIDEMLINLYGMRPFYNIKKREDLLGHFCLGLSPHTSAGVLCRIIGFTKANVGYGHPYFHTAKRRNCDGDEDSIMLLLDALINFSRKFLDEKRGGTMDAPLVLTTVIDPKEVDDEAHSIEIVSSYPLEFYTAAERITPPGDVKIRTIKNVLGTPEQHDFPITHPGSMLEGANEKTTYVMLQTMREKITAQFDLHEKIRAVDKKDAASRLILSHFIPDLYGNLRSFSRQTFRCVNCNTIYRRVPLSGKCRKCGGNLLLTINKGGIEKYLQISREIVDRYELPDYTKQRLELIGKEINSIFEDEKNKQTGLSDFL